jgi:shikimate kinase
MHQRIVIIGFMGCGKTTVARELARQLEGTHIDLDSFIYDREGRSPAEIIKEDGENQFREVETLALRDVLQDFEARVIALGGGTWTIPANRTLVALHDCATVWLDTSFEVCWARIESSQIIRPLAPDREMAARRYNNRKGSYQLSGLRVSTEGLSPGAIATEVIRLLR